MTKIAIIIFSNSESHTDLGKMTNAIEILNEFIEAGDEATLLFDGAGVTWPPKLSNEEHPLHENFNKIKPHILGACAYCSKAFKVGEGVKNAGISFLKEHNGHPSIHSLVKKGYQIIPL